MRTSKQYSHSELDFVSEHLNTAVLCFDADLCLQYINGAGEQLLNLSWRKAEGWPAAKLLPGATDLLQRMQDVLDGEITYTQRHACLGLPGDNAVNSADLTISAVADGIPKFALLLEIVPLDRHLRITQEETLVAQQSASRAVVRGLAHEIKNPLGGLRGAAQLLQRQFDDPELLEYTEVIIGEADRLQALVDRLLGPNTPPAKRAVELHEVTERVVRLLKAEAWSGIKIVRDYDISIPDLHADANQLIQALLNVVRNACEVMEGEGQITVRTRIDRQITINNERHKLVAHIKVIDNGPGIPEHLQDSIFYPMVTNRAGGTGLGLSISQSLINGHGGLIECSSRQGHTEFSILLPISTGTSS